MPWSSPRESTNTGQPVRFVRYSPSSRGLVRLGVSQPLGNLFSLVVGSGFAQFLAPGLRFLLMTTTKLHVPEESRRIHRSATRRFVLMQGRPRRIYGG